MYETRIKHLEEVHRVLDKRIENMELTGVFDNKHLHTLKKNKNSGSRTLSNNSKVTGLKERLTTANQTMKQELDKLLCDKNAKIFVHLYPDMKESA